MAKGDLDDLVDGTEPPAKEPPPEFGEDEGADAPSEAYVMDATLVNHSESGGSGVGGTTEKIKFEIHDEDLARLILDKVIGQVAFDVTFARARFGSGLSIRTYNGGADEDGAARAWIIVTVPENQQQFMAVIHTRRLTKKQGKLILAPMQSTMDEALTRRAE